MLTDKFTKALVVSPAAAWPEIIAKLRQSVHPADFWCPDKLEAVLTIGEVRSFLYFADFTPVGEYKLAVLPGADRFRPETANALLKILEEPPKHVRLLVLAETNNLLPTLLSRLPRLADNVHSATIENNANALSLWQKRLAELDLTDQAQRQKAKNLLYLYPLVHTGIKSENILEAL